MVVTPDTDWFSDPPRPPQTPQYNKTAHFRVAFYQVQVQVELYCHSLHVGTYSGTKCRASQDHGAT